MQAINTAVLDIRPNLRKHESLVILGICVTGWILGLPMVFAGGVYLYTLMDWNTASWAILLIGFAEVTLPAWCYGCNKFLGNIAEMQMPFGRILHGYWRLSWVVLAPITALVSTCHALSISNETAFATSHSCSGSLVNARSPTRPLSDSANRSTLTETVPPNRRTTAVEL